MRRPRLEKKPRSICGRYARALTERLFVGRERRFLVMDPKGMEVLLRMAFHQGWEAGKRSAVPGMLP